MAKVTYLDPVKDVSGKVSHADRTCYNHRRASGKNFTSVPQKRDYTSHPLTSREVAARAAFKSAHAAAVAIIKDEAQKMAAMDRFNAAKKAKTTTATTLMGFLTQEAM